MKKRMYRSTAVKNVKLEPALEAIGDAPVIIGVDIAKVHMFARIEVSAEPVITVRWKHPDETTMFVELLVVFLARGPVEVVMESSGTYGDALRAMLERANVLVFRVNPKRCHDAAERVRWRAEFARRQ